MRFAEADPAIGAIPYGAVRALIDGETYVFTFIRLGPACRASLVGLRTQYEHAQTLF